MSRKFKFGPFSRRYTPHIEISRKGGEYRMQVNQKRKKVKVKRKLFFECQCCGKLVGVLLDGHCAYCHELNAKIEAYAEWLEARGLLPSLEDDPKAYYPRS